MNLDEAVAVLRGGGAAVFPTDTVYGLGVAVDFAESPHDLYRIKGRDDGKPIAWLVGGEADILRYGADVPAYALSLVRAFWPGALTIVVRASAAVPPAFLPAGKRPGAAGATIGLRMPGSEVALGLIRAVGCPLATTSANVSGAPAVSRFADLDPVVLAAAGAVVGDAAPADGGVVAATAAPAGETHASALASTVVDCTGDAPVILREGGVSSSQIARVLAV